MDNLNIFLIRHGESQLNANESGLEYIPDHALSLTENGKKQATLAGIALRKLFIERDIKISKTKMWVSPYKRTRQTAEIIGDELGLTGNQIREDDMLVEINFGLFDGISKADQEKLYPNEYKKFQKDRLEMGKFYARRPGGESGMDVEMRLRIFFGTILRDYNSGGPENLIVVCHGGLMNVFIKAFLHRSHEWYYNQKNPGNCSIIHLKSNTGESSYAYGVPEEN